MNEPVSTTSETPQKIEWPSVIQFGLSGLAVIGFWSIALMNILPYFFTYIDPDIAGNDYAYTVTASGWFLMGLVVVFSMLFSGARLLNSSESLEKWFLLFKNALHPRRLILALPILLIIGHFISPSPTSVVMLPLVHFLSAVIAISWLLWLGIRNLPKGSGQRDLGIFTSGMAFSPFITIIFEIIALFIVGLAVILLISRNPEIMTDFQRSLLQLQASQGSPEKMMRVIGELSNNPTILSSAMLFIAVIVPALEEMLKPIGVWLLSGRKLTESDGMVIGMISGAGFTFFETMTTVPTDVDWILVIPLRMATGTLHIVTAGMVGWALMKAITQRRFALLLAAYILAVLNHSIWNTAAGLFNYASFLHQLPELHKPPIVPGYTEATTAILLCVMAVLNFMLLLFANKWMRAKVVVEYAADQQPETEIL